jgi:hypothetical protein
MFFLIFIILYGFLNLYHYSNKIKTLKYFIQLQLIDSHIDEGISLDLDYYNKNFAMIKRVTAPTSGLFSDYIRFLGCIRKYMIQGYIPIIDLESYKNSINGFQVNSSKGNPWEYYFNQPFGYKYSIVKKKARNIKNFECKPDSKQRPNYKIFLKKNMNYWHFMAEKYIPLKNELINLMRLVKL